MAFKCEEGVGESGLQQPLRASYLHDAERAVQVRGGHEHHIHTQLVADVDYVGLFIARISDPPVAARGQHAVHGLECVDAVAFPGLGHQHRDGAQFTDFGQAAAQVGKLLGVSHAAAGGKMLAFVVPCGELLEPVTVVGQRLIDEDGQPRIDERAGAVDVFVADVCSDDHGVHVTDHVLGFRDDVRDVRRSGDLLGLSDVVAPDVSDLYAVDTKIFLRLGVEVLTDDRVAAVGDDLTVVPTVDDRRPAKRVAVAVDHAEHRQADVVWVRDQWLCHSVDFLDSGVAAVDRQINPGNIGGRVGRQEDEGALEISIVGHAPKRGASVVAFDEPCVLVVEKTAGA